MTSRRDFFPNWPRPFRFPQVVRSNFAPCRARWAPIAFRFRDGSPEAYLHGAWARISGAAADELTLRWNHEAYEHIRLKPGALVDVSKLETRVTLFGQELPFPILLAPTGGQKFVHPGGRACGRTRRCGGQSDLRDQQQRLHARRRHSEGCYCARMVPALRTARSRFHTRVGTRCGGFRLPRALRDRRFSYVSAPAIERTAPKVNCPSANSRTSRARTISIPPSPGRTSIGSVPSRGARAPEGHPESGRRGDAVKAGVAGIIVSNHGARNLDTVPATIDALPPVVERVAGRISGFSRWRYSPRNGCTQGAGAWSGGGADRPAVSLGPGYRRVGWSRSRRADSASRIRTGDDVGGKANSREH